MQNERSEAIGALLEGKQYHQIMNVMEDMNVVDIAEVLEELPFNSAVVLYRMLKKDISTDVFSELSPEMQERIISSVTDQELSLLVEDLYVDDAVDMLEELPAHVVKRVLRNANPNTRRLINQFLNYPEDSAGSIMTAEFVHLKKDMTVSQAIAYIRNTSLEKETVYMCYVTDSWRVLEGVVSIEDLMFAELDTRIGDLMDTDVICGVTTDDKEEIAAKISKYGFLALPIVDHENRLVGIVTVDDAVDVMEEEATEDFERMAAMLPSEKPYLKTGVFAHVKNRFGWLLILMLSSMITGSILTRFEEAFAQVPLLVSFITMITGTGGNAGSQTSTTIIRGMTVGELMPKDWLRILWKEFRVSILVGGTLAVVNFLRLSISYHGQLTICLAVALGVWASVFIAQVIGCILPVLAKALKQDPAVMAAPIITTLVDAGALIIYFSIASALFGITL
ncbi:MAG: magnesium transporter [Lachnospiraceae bacterium]